MGFGNKEDEVLFKIIILVELLEGLGDDKEMVENFFCIVVLVAIVDGFYFLVEGELLWEFS